MGAPSKYTDVIAGQILERMAEGESLRSIARDPAMPALRTIFGWLSVHETFRASYQLASDARLDAWAEDIVAMADGGEVTSEAVARDRLKIDSRKWLMARLMPKKYGERTSVETTAEVVVKDRAPDLSRLTWDERQEMRRMLLKASPKADD